MCKMICFQVTLSDPHVLPVRHRYFEWSHIQCNRSCYSPSMNFPAVLPDDTPGDFLDYRLYKKLHFYWLTSACNEKIDV